VFGSCPADRTYRILLGKQDLQDLQDPARQAGLQDLQDPARQAGLQDLQDPARQAGPTVDASFLLS
jgi:hypothetical protein